MLTSTDHAYVQALVDRASTPDEMSRLRQEAESTLSMANAMMSAKILSSEENKAIALAIETLVRLEAKENGGGWWFRTRRRLQLTTMYLG